MTPSTMLRDRISSAPGRSAWREARLRSGSSELYPGIRPGEWRPAAALADHVLAGLLLRGAETALLGRVLPEAHFEFRGGTTIGGEREGIRFRRPGG